MVEIRIQKIWDRTRKDFFREWGEDMDSFNFEEDDSNLIPPMMAKASAWYQVAYDSEHGNNRFLLSFPWVVWDILKYIKRQQTYGSVDIFGDQSTVALDPITEKLFVEIRDRTKLVQFKSAFEGRKPQLQYIELLAHFIIVVFFSDWQNAKSECEAIRTACQLNSEFDGDFVVLINWAVKEKAIDHGKIHSVHLCLLFIQFIYEISETKIQPGQDISPPARAAEYLLHFIRYLGSEEFRNLPELRFPNLDNR